MHKYQAKYCINQIYIFYICIAFAYNMTITQLEYIVALADFKSFSKAADHCCVSQPSLSMQVQKLEDELNLTLFNRKVKPLEPTLEAKEILTKARVILSESKSILSFTKGWSTQVNGNLSIGVIPTIAPYLMPRFLSDFQLKYPDLTISISETTTENIKAEIAEGRIDIGILVTPLNTDLVEVPLYYEELFLYSNVWEEDGSKLSAVLDPAKLWLLEEGHCLSNQINSICNIQAGARISNSLTYQTGSLETIVRMADLGFGQTIIPQMFVDYLDVKSKEKVHSLPKPIPIREVSLVHANSYSRIAIINALKMEILAHIPLQWRSIADRSIIPI
jgi:LysR family hydrogen peroxide-inducible transcriptional activator